MHPEIEKAVQAINDAEASYSAIAASVRKTCPHDRVIHSKWRSSEYGPPFKARRLCLICGLEEEAKNSGFGDYDSDFNRLKTGGFHKVVSSNELYNARFPTTEVRP